MPPITELCHLYPKEGADIEAIWADIAKVVLPQPGVKSVYTSAVIEEDNPLKYVFVDWDSVESHEAFKKTEVYEPLVKRLNENLTTPPFLHNVELFPTHPAVLHNERGKSAVVELVKLFFPAGDAYTSNQMASVAKNVRDFIDLMPGHAAGYSGEAAGGWAIHEVDFKGEKTRVFVIAIGWETVQAHLDYRETDHFKANVTMLTTLDNMKGTELAHIKTKEW